VLVVGGGWGGATAARYLRLLSDHRLEVVLIEPAPRFVSCPLSNLVLGGSRRLDELSLDYDTLAVAPRRAHRAGTGRRDRHRHAARDPRRQHALRYDRLVLSPGVELQHDRVEGWPTPSATAAS
jgi:NADPH-dependent 2,4-dienoyl-CoA reductase/sulfur reductase-like enzyme